MIALPTRPRRKSGFAGESGSYVSVIRRGGFSLPWLTAEKAPIPAARISSGPSASKRSARVAGGRLLGPGGKSLGRELVRRSVDEVAAAVRPGHDQARRAASSAPAAAPGPQRTRRSSLTPSSPFVFHRPFSYSPRSVPSTIARACSAGERSPLPSTSQAIDRPPTSFVCRATAAAAVRSESGSSASLPTPAAPTRRAPSRPSVCVRATDPRLPRISPSSMRRASRPSSRRSRPSADSVSVTGWLTGKTRTSASTPPGGASTTSISMGRGMVSEPGLVVPLSRDQPLPGAADIKCAPQSAAPPSPQPAPSPAGEYLSPSKPST